MKLNVLICCYGSSIVQVPSVLKELREDVRYIISHQQDDEYAASRGRLEDMGCETVATMLGRSDVVYSVLPGVGLSRNRNNCIQACAAVASSDDVCIIADDDVRYMDGSFDAILGAFASRKEADVIAFRISTGDPAVPFKVYPRGAHEVLKPVIRGNGYVSSIEMAFRLASVLGKGLKFDEDFGLKGRRYPQAGEEAVFISDCLKAGLRVFHEPVEVVVHPWESSGKSAKTVAKAKMMLAVAKRTYGALSVEAFIARARCVYRAVKNL